MERQATVGTWRTQEGVRLLCLLTEWSSLQKKRRTLGDYHSTSSRECCEWIGRHFSSWRTKVRTYLLLLVQQYGVNHNGSRKSKHGPETGLGMRIYDTNKDPHQPYRCPCLRLERRPLCNSPSSCFSQTGCSLQHFYTFARGHATNQIKHTEA